MKTLLTIATFVFALKVANSQSDAVGVTSHKFDAHGFELELNSSWQVLRKPNGQCEILYGCKSINDFCANIQIASGPISGVSLAEISNQTIKLMKRDYPELKFSTSSMSLNGVTFHMTDFIVKGNGRYVFQTLTLTESQGNFVQIAYSSGMYRDEVQGIKAYPAERERFINILKSFKELPREQEAAVSNLHLRKLISCNDSLSIMLTQVNDLSCRVLVKGKAESIGEGKAVVSGKTRLVASLIEAASYRGKNNSSTLINYAQSCVTELYNSAFPDSKSKPTFMIDFINGQNLEAVICYLVDPSTLPSKNNANINVNNIRPYKGIIFVGTVTGDYIYTIIGGQDEGPVKEFWNLLSKLILTLKYSHGPFDEQDLCRQF